MKKALRLAIIGNGFQVRKHHLPYLVERCKNRADLELCWASGCTCTAEEAVDCPLKAKNLVQYCAPNTHLCDWKELFTSDRPDAVIISTPNATHYEIIHRALTAGIHVAVDKPPVISTLECKELTSLAQKNNCAFLTISQRRYEDVFQTMKKRMAQGDLGQIRLINYFTANSFSPNSWRKKKRLAGGGIIIDSAYHGIDVILWLLQHLPPEDKITPVRLSADWLLDSTEQNPEEKVEILGAMRIVMSNGCIFNVAASYGNPTGSIDESIKIFGNKGAIRYVRDKLFNNDMTAGRLSYQRQDGESCIENDGQTQAKRWAPLEDFLDCIATKNTTVYSPASDSTLVLKIIEAAYQSAAKNGELISLTEPETQVALNIDHVAVQTNDLDQSIDFYVRIIGAVLIERRNFKKRDMAWLKVGRTKIELFSKRKGEALQAWSDFYSGPVHLAFQVKNLDVFLSDALGKGAKFHPSHPAPFTPPVPGASKIAYLLGPDGEEIEIRDNNNV